MPKTPSLRRRSFRIFVLAFFLFSDYFFHPLLVFLRSSGRREESRRRLHRRNAIRLRKAAVSLKGVLIKLCQFMSARVDVLPEEYTRELALLQDQVPPASFPEIRERIQKELGDDPFRLFEGFEESPIASASLGQVHAAALDGRKVAVKVQYPGIQEVVEVDLRAVRLITRFLQHYIKNVRFDILYDEFSNLIYREMDYLKEGRNAERFRENFSHDPRIVVPEVIWSHTTRHVLTLEFVEGTKISQVDAMRAQGISPKDVSTLLVESYIRQILQHRFFHGDPHPGNLFVQFHPGSENPVRLVFVDFGLMQDITPEIYEGIHHLMLSIIDRDNRGISIAMIDLGFIARTHRLRDVEKAVAFFMERYRDMSPRQFRNITVAQLAEDLVTLLRVIPALQVPNHFILFARTAGMLNGLCSQMNPDLNIIELARPHAEQFAKRDGLIDRLVTRGGGIAKSVIELPEALHRFLQLASSGQFRTEMHSEDLSGILTRIYRLAYRAFLAVLAFALFFYFSYLAPSLPVLERLVVGLFLVLLASALLWTYFREGNTP